MRGGAARRRTLALSLAAALAAGPALLGVPSAHAVVACQKGKRVKVRPQCKRKERRVPLDIEPAAPPTGSEVLEAVRSVDGAGSGLDADTVRGLTPAAIAALAATGPVVRDANGALVGHVLPRGLSNIVTTTLRVVREIAGALVLVEVSPAGLNPDFFIDEVFFEGTDCTGAPFVKAGVEDFASFSATIGTTLYYEVPGAPNGPNPGLQRRLFETDATTCTNIGGVEVQPGVCCQPQGTQTDVAEATTFDLSTLGLVPPFHVEVPQ